MGEAWAREERAAIEAFRRWLLRAGDGEDVSRVLVRRSLERVRRSEALCRRVDRSIIAMRRLTGSDQPERPDRGD
jgi:hypothetical protein